MHPEHFAVLIACGARLRLTIRMSKAVSLCFDNIRLSGNRLINKSICDGDRDARCSD